jgi:hypothetical protein
MSTTGIRTRSDAAAEEAATSCERGSHIGFLKRCEEERVGVLSAGIGVVTSKLYWACRTVLQ